MTNTLNIYNTIFKNKLLKTISQISSIRTKFTDNPTHDNPRKITPGFNNPSDLLRQELYGEGASRLKVPSETDICIIGGGAIGLATAYWLKKRHPNGFMVTVIERDPTVSNIYYILLL